MPYESYEVETNAADQSLQDQAFDILQSLREVRRVVDAISGLAINQPPQGPMPENPSLTATMRMLKDAVHEMAGDLRVLRDKVGIVG